MKRLRFLHIPKTAGTTFNYLLRRQYLGKRHFLFTGDLSDRERFNALPERARRKVVLFTGHAPLFTGISEADEATIITMLRDPVARVKSFCQYVAEGKSYHMPEDLPNGSFSLDTFLESGDEELYNLQTKMLIDSRQSAASDLIGMSPSEARDTALENLTTQVFQFGLQEYFDESLLVFADSLNWSLPIYVSQNRKNKKQVLEFKSRHLEKISELNAVDIEVYEAAKKMFLERKSRIDPYRLKKFRQIRRLASPPLHLLNLHLKLAQLLNQ